MRFMKRKKWLPFVFHHINSKKKLSLISTSINQPLCITPPIRYMSIHPPSSPKKKSTFQIPIFNPIVIQLLKCNFISSLSLSSLPSYSRPISRNHPIPSHSNLSLQEKTQRKATHFCIFVLICICIVGV